MTFLPSFRKKEEKETIILCLWMKSFLRFVHSADNFMGKNLSDRSFWSKGGRGGGGDMSGEGVTVCAIEWWMERGGMERRRMVMVWLLHSRTRIVDP